MSTRRNYAGQHKNHCGRGGATVDSQGLIYQFVTGAMSAEAINAGSIAFKKVLIEGALGGELGYQLGHASGSGRPSPRKLPTAQRHEPQDTAHDHDPLHIEVPRDRHGSFEPVLIPKREHPFMRSIATIKA